MFFLHLNLASGTKYSLQKKTFSPVDGFFLLVFFYWYQFQDILLKFGLRSDICQKTQFYTIFGFFFSSQINLKQIFEISEIKYTFSEVSNKRACTFTNFQLFFHPAHSYYILHILGKIQPALLIDPAHFMCTIWNSGFFKNTMQKVNKIVDDRNLEASDCE